MNKYKKFIKTLGQGPSVHSLNVRERFPELFEVKFEVDKWYNLIEDNKVIVCYKGYDNSYGISDCYVWGRDLMMTDPNKWTPATDKEVKEMLIKEAKKKFGDYTVIDLSSRRDKGVLKYSSAYLDGGGLWIMPKGKGLNLLVFSQGKWVNSSSGCV